MLFLDTFYRYYLKWFHIPLEIIWISKWFNYNSNMELQWKILSQLQKQKKLKVKIFYYSTYLYLNRKHLWNELVMFLHLSRWSFSANFLTSNFTDFEEQVSSILSVCLPSVSITTIAAVFLGLQLQWTVYLFWRS